MTSISIPNNVTTIGERAFSGCSSLKTISLGKKLEKINYCTFMDCISLTSISIPSSTTHIGSNAFKNNTSLQTVTLKSGLVTIDYSAFYKCTSLEKITIPNTVTSINSNAFKDCTSLTSAVIGNSVITIGDSAFDNDSNLSTLTIGQSVNTIDSSAFANCTSLTSVTIPNSTLSIGSRAFSNNTSLKEVKLGNSLTNINYYSFANNPSLTDVYIYSSNVNIYENAFTGCPSVTLHGYKESTTQTYAQNKNFSFKTLVSKKLTSDLLYLTKTSYTWNRNYKLPAVKSDAGLKEGFDYTVLYDYSSNAGTHYVEIYGENAYSGEILKLKYKISPVKLSDCKITVSSAKSYNNGSAVKPSVTVKYGSITLKNGTDYTLTYSNNKNVGTAKVKISAKKNTTGSAITKSFKIVPKAVTLSSVANSSSKKMKVTWKASTSSNCTGYQIQYSTSSSFSNAKTITVSSYKSKTKTISNLTKGKKYYVRIRAYKKVSGKNYYSNWSKTKSVKISK